MGKSTLITGRWFLAAVLAVLVGWQATAWGDTTLFADGTWRVVGTTDPAPDARDIAVTVDGVPVGVFSAVTIAHAFTGADYPRFFAVTGRGAILLNMPPPGEVGGSFYLTRYFDCVAGLSPDLRITDLDLPRKAGGSLKINGRATNLDSLEATKLRFKFLAPKDDRVIVEMKYKLVATRDFCVDEFRQDVGEGFQVARMAANYLSPDQHDNDLLQYQAFLDKRCDCCDCVKIFGSVCGTLHNQDSTLVCFEDQLDDPYLALAHTSAYPRNTPTLAIRFRSPGYKKLNPQGVSEATLSPTAENIQFWGNWRRAKSSYRSGKKVGNFRVDLEAYRPGIVWCDADACP